MKIITDRLILRNMSEEDRNDCFAIFMNDDVCRYLPYYAWTDKEKDSKFNEKLAHDSLKEKHILDLAVEYGSRMIGVVSAWYSTMKETVEIGYVFNKEYYKNGYATEAVFALCTYLFKEENVHRVYADTDTRNVDSYRLLERIGMRREAHFISDYYAKDEWTDSYIYGMLRNDLDQSIFKKQ